MACLLGPDPDSAGLGARPLWEDLGEAGEIFEVIDGFAVVRRLGAGGMGEVFLARQLSTGREVALKLLRATVSPARFRKEIAALAALRHPGVVQILHVGEHAGHPYFAMEFVPGSDLSVRLRERPLPAREAVVLMASVARAMEHAHGQGFLHRDLKPQNILLGLDGLPRVTDFGLARFLGEASADGTTVTGARLGTPSFMAPEQVSGWRDLEGTWTDVYGMGATLYALLTGSAPFQADSVEATFRLVVHQEPVSPRRLRPDLDRDVETLVLGALTKEPTSRYQTAAQWAEELERWLRGEPIRRRPAGLATRLWKWARRKPAVAALATTIAGVTALGAAGVLWQWREAKLASVNLERSNLRATSLLAAQSRELKEPLRALALHLRSVPSDRSAAVVLLDRLSREPFPFPIMEIGPASGGLATVRWSSNSGWLAPLFQSGGGDAVGARVWSVAARRWAGPERQLGTLPGEARFSPDGEWFATSFSEGVRLWRAPGLDPAGAAVDDGPGGAEFAWHPLKPELVTWDGSGRLIRIRATDRFHSWTATVDGTPSCVAFAGNGFWVAIGLAAGGVRVLNADNGREERRVDTGPGAVLAVALDPDASNLAVLKQAGTDSPAMSLIRLGDGDTLGPFDNIEGMAFSPDGVWLAGVGTRPLILKVASGERPPQPAGERLVSTHAWVGPGSGLVWAVGDRSAHIRRTASGEASAHPVWHPSVIEDLQPSPDGTMLAIVDFSQTVSVWRAEVPVLDPMRVEGARVLAVHPEGSLLATGGGDGAVRWVSNNGLGPWNEAVLMEGAVGALRFSSGGRWLAAGTAKGDVRLLAGGIGGAVRQLEWDAGTVRALAFSGDEEVLAVLGTKSSLRFYRTADGAPLGPVIAVESGRESPFGSGSWTVEFQPGTRRAAVGSYSRIVTLWDAAGSNLVQEIRHPAGGVMRIVFDPRGEWMATGSMDGFVRIWNTKGWTERFPAMNHGASVTSMTARPGGSLLASAGASGEVRLWDVRTGAATVAMRWPHEGSGDWSREIGFSRAGDRLASVSVSGTVRVFDVASGAQLMKPWGFDRSAGSLAWSGDGRVLAVALESGEGRLIRLPKPDQDAPRWLWRLADAAAGNVPGSNAVSEWEICRREALGAGSTGFYRRWAEWFFEGRFTGAQPGW
ncbi:MAG: protein kinase [Verrucomicrobiae bacterium]|nr:protein kinase [Verrucomicrobiae bacterium]